MASDAFDPYAGQILNRGLGPVLSREQIVKRLTYLPPLPPPMDGIPVHIRLHLLMEIRDLHWPDLEGVRVCETVDLMIRQGYRYRDPTASETWGIISRDGLAPVKPRTPEMASVVVGHSGVGKTEAITKSFDCYQRQIIVHEEFPRLIGPHYQMIYLSASVPSSGRLEDLAANLMTAWDMATSEALPSMAPRFAQTLDRARRDGPRMMDEWRQVAASHFLGNAHLDEVQNFFKLPSLERRRSSKAGDGPPELSVIDDQALKHVLTMIGSWRIPFTLSGTPDGIGALTRRLSNVERFVANGGYHRMPEYPNAQAPGFVVLVDILGKYQYVRKRIAVSDELRQVIFDLTAGINRLIIALWIAAHRVAFERRDDDLRISDFKKAAGTYLAPVAPAVAALLSKDPIQMRLYEDLMPRDDGFWKTFWGQISRT